MHEDEEHDQPAPDPEETERLRRGREESFWLQRIDTRENLSAQWNRIRSDTSSQGGPAFPLLLEHAGMVAALLKGDPEAIVEGFSVGCLLMLVEERLKGGPRAEEAHAAIVSICDGLVSSYTEGQGPR